MDENQTNEANEQKQESDLKQETVKTFNEAKEQMKNINFKEEARAGKSLLMKLWKNPIKTIKEIVNDNENKTFKTSLLLIVAWMAIELIDIVIYYIGNKYVEFNFMYTLKSTIAPAIRIIAMTLALYFVNNRAKISISKVLTSVTIAHIPSIISSALWLLYRVSTKMSTLLSPISGLLRALTIVLMYKTIKEFTQKDDEENAFKDFVKVEAIYYVIVLAISFLGINL